VGGDHKAEGAMERMMAELLDLRERAAMIETATGDGGCDLIKTADAEFRLLESQHFSAAFGRCAKKHSSLFGIKQASCSMLRFTCSRSP